MNRLVTAALALAVSTPSLASDWYVILNAFPTQQDAWRASATTGGWVLDNDLYNGLKPDQWSLVRGPFQSVAEARKALKVVQRVPGFEKAYTKEAGDLKLPGPLGAPGTPPIVIAALLGELNIQVEVQPGGHAPCVPATDHWMVTLQGRNVMAGDSPTTVREPVELPSRMAVDRQTGELLYLTGCATPEDAPQAPEPTLPAGEEGAAPTEGG